MPAPQDTPAPPAQPTAQNPAAPSPAIAHPQWVLLAVCALSLMSTVGVAMPYPILAPIFMGSPADGFNHFAGLPPAWLMGLALAVNPLGILLGSLVLGSLSDRLGRRPLLAATLLAGMLCYGLTALALVWRNYPLFVLARLLTGLTEGNVSIARALLADLHPAVDRTRGFAWLNASLYIGWLLGPLFGGLSLPLGEPVPFALAALAMLPCLVVVMAGVPPQPASAAETAPSPTTATGWWLTLRGWWATLREQQSLGLLWREPLLARLFGLQLTFTAGVNALYEFEPLWMMQIAGLGSVGIAGVVALQCAVMTAASLLAGRAGTPARPLRRAAAMAACTSAGLLALGLAPAVPGMALIVLLGAPLAVYNAVLPAWMSTRFGNLGQGRLMGLLSTTFCIANVLVALLGGLMAHWDVRWILLLGGLACAASVPALSRWDRLEHAAPTELRRA